jgi:hypothetical protein
MQAWRGGRRWKGGAAGKFYIYRNILSAAAKKKEVYVGEDFVYERKAEGRAPRKNIGHLNASPQ